MGIRALQWSLIQLRMVNSQKIIPKGRLQGINVDIEGAIALANLKVIEIVDDNNPYPTLPGIYWTTNMNGSININMCKMISERKSLCVVVPLDPTEGSHYIELVHDDESNDNLDCIYKVTTRE